MSIEDVQKRMETSATMCGLTFSHHTIADGDIEMFYFKKGGKHFKAVSKWECAFYWLEGYKDGTVTSIEQRTP
jgi:hypothetical protein